MNHQLTVRPLSQGGPDRLGEVAYRRELAEKYFIWDAYVGGARRVDIQPLVLPAALHASAVRAAEGVVRVVGGIAARAHDDAEERARYQLLPSTIALAEASRAGGDDGIVARVDLLLGHDGAWRACEINSDSPGGHNEALGLPCLARAAGFSEGFDPTHLTRGLVSRLTELSRGDAVALLHATGYAEDLQICALLQRLLRERGVRAVLAPPTAPRLVNGRFVVRGEKVGVAYRYFPTEYMDGQRNIGDLVTALREGLVRSFTAFSHIYTQSKLAFARTWSALGELDEASASIVRECIPETIELSSVGAARLIAERASWVVKRAFGRVGDQVFVGDLYDDAEWASVVSQVCAVSGSESWIAQRFVPQQAIATPWGDRLVTLGAYVLDGRFVGYFARLTPQSHVSHDALCLPVFAEHAS